MFVGGCSQCGNCENFELGPGYGGFCRIMFCMPVIQDDKCNCYEPFARYSNTENNNENE